MTLLELSRWRDKNISTQVVACVGCFDGLTPHHFNFLNRCRSISAPLIVGLYSDEAVKKIKDSVQPNVMWIDRQMMLLHIVWVNYVAMVEDTNNLRFLKSCRPDIWCGCADNYLPAFPKDEVNLIKKQRGQIVFIE